MSRTYRKIFLESYDKVRQIEQQEKDHEISMARSELEAISDKALRLSSLLQGRTEEGNPLEAWVQSKITKAKDYINSALDYMQYTPDLAKESVNEDMKIDEVKMSDIFKMQQDGKTAEDIAKELGLSALFVKRILGEDREWTTSPIAKTLEEALSDTQISMLKKEYDPLKGKTITSAQYQQLKNLLYKLQDGDLEKLQKQNIPFASSGAATALRVRKAKFKITKVTVPGLEGMAEEQEKNPYAIGMAAAMKATGDTPPLKKSTIVKAHKIADKVKNEEVEIKEYHYSMGQNVIYKPKGLTPRKAKIIQVTEPQFGFHHYKIKISPTLTTYAKPDELELDEEKIPMEEIIENGASKSAVKHKLLKPIRDYLKQKESDTKKEACWTGYKQVGLKKKNGKMVPNCVPEETLREQKRLYIESIVAVKNKAEKSGMPYSILKQVYNRGMAAWKGGHRPGATQVQWALARVNSFVTKSSGTWGGADSDLAKKVKGSK